MGPAMAAGGGGSGAPPQIGSPPDGVGSGAGLAALSGGGRAPRFPPLIGVVGGGQRCVREAGIVRSWLWRARRWESGRRRPAVIPGSVICDASFSGSGAGRIRYDLGRNRVESRLGKRPTDLGLDVEGEPDGGEVAPPELALGDVASGGELVPRAHGVVSALAVPVDPLVVTDSGHCIDLTPTRDRQRTSAAHPHL